MTDKIRNEFAAYGLEILKRCVLAEYFISGVMEGM